MVCHEDIRRISSWHTTRQVSYSVVYHIGMMNFPVVCQGGVEIYPPSIPGWEIFFPTGMPVLLVCQGGFFCQPPWYTTEEFDNLTCMPGWIFLEHPWHTREVFYNLPCIPGVIFFNSPLYTRGDFDYLRGISGWISLISSI